MAHEDASKISCPSIELGFAALDEAKMFASQFSLGMNTVFILLFLPYRHCSERNNDYLVQKGFSMS